MSTAALGLSRSDFTMADDGLLELTDEKLKSLLRTEPITDVYHVEQTPFARGKFASVRKIRHLETGEEFAAKFIRKRRRAADSTREIHHEVAVLALCAGTPRVVRLHEVFDMRTEVAIVLELASGGELQRVLDEEERLSEAAARRAMRHVLEGLAHLHARRVAHLDLKPQNLLLDGDTGDLCICDFGISRAIQPGAVVREILGTRDYVAPEILSYEPISLAADVWSVGVLAYVLLSGYSPFAGATKQETYLNIAQCSLTFPEELFHDVSPAAQRFVRDTLIAEPRSRLTVEQCLEHPWLQDDEGSVPRTLTISADAEPPHGLNGHCETNGYNGHCETNGCNGHCETNGFKGHCETNGFNGHCETNGTNGHHDSGGYETNGHDINGHETNGHDINGHEKNGHDSNGDADESSEDRDKPLKHPHERETSPPFPDAPSTPKVSRKSHPVSPTSVRQLCKKFQPDYGDKVLSANKIEARATHPPTLHAAHGPHAPPPASKENAPCGCGYECAECAPHACLRPSRPPLPPDRAIIC